jgi:hypothetical protein
VEDSVNNVVVGLPLKYIGLYLLVTLLLCSFSDIYLYRQEGIAPQPDKNVIRIENESGTAAKLARAKHKGGMEVRLPSRPGYGTKGKPVILWANYFNIVSLNLFYINVVHVRQYKVQNIMVVECIFKSNWFSSLERF